MGITIHYRGKIADIGKVKDVCYELNDIAGSMHWPCSSLDEDFSKPMTADLVHDAESVEITGHLPLKGVSIKPHPECELFNFYFDKEGNVSSPITYIMASDGSVKPDKAFVFVKTQFAPIDVHITLIKLLKYLKKRYVPNLEVVDEGGYWETDDKELLKEKMDFLSDKIKMTANALSTIGHEDVCSLSSDDMANLIEKILREKMNPKNKNET